MPERGGRRLRTVLAVLLALLCVTGVELLACRLFAPALFERVVTSVTTPILTAADWGRRGSVRLLTARREAAGALAEAMVTTVRDAWVEAQERIDRLFFPEPPAVQQEAGEAQLAPERGPTEDEGITRFVREGEREWLTGGLTDITYYHQDEEPWAEQPYGYDDIGRYGCGPTVMAMVVDSLTDTASDPAQMADWAFAHGQWASRSGSNHTIVEEAAAAFGLAAAPLTEREAGDIVSALTAGKLVVALMGPGHFTTGGHFILLRGVTLTGQVLVADPNSRERSLTEWDPSLIAEELSTARSGGAPLWTVERPAGE